MAVTIYNHALEDYFPVDLSEYGFNKNVHGNSVWASSQGETLSFLETGDQISITFKAAGSETKITLNDAEYTVADGEVTVSEIALIMPITVTTSENAAGGIVVYSCTKKSIPATTDDNFANMHLYFPFSPTGETLEAATADFTVYTDTPSKWDKGTVIDIYDADGILGRFYVDTCIKTYAGQYAITASDVINRLASLTFYGYIGYEETVKQDSAVNYIAKKFLNLGQVLSDVFGQYSYSISAALKSQEVSGYIPFGDSRDALQYLCLGFGLFVRTYRTDKPIVQSADEFATHTIPETRVSDSVSVSEKEALTAVSLTMPRYITKTFQQNFYDTCIFQGRLPIGQTVLTEGMRTYTNSKSQRAVDQPREYILAPRDGLSVPTRYGNIVKAMGVSTIVNTIIDKGYNAEGDGSSYDAERNDSMMQIDGKPIVAEYFDLPIIYTRDWVDWDVEKTFYEPFQKIFGSGKALQLSENATTVTIFNAEAVANRMINHYRKSREATVSYIMSKNEMPGDKLILPLDKTYGNISGRVLSLDITPGVSKNFADAIIICDEGDTNA